jgi:hypothetical protein
VKLRLVLGILSIAAMPFSGVVVAQDTDDATHTATGCLDKTPVGNVYLLTDQDGKTWDLRSTTVPLGTHVGHTVTVTGTIPKDSKGGRDTTPQNHLLVSKLDMVRDNCKEP